MSPLTQHSLGLKIQAQPDDVSCGPTCLQAVYQHYGLTIPLTQLIDEIPTLTDGGTLAVSLGTHALKLGFRVSILTFNLKVFDPSWFAIEKQHETYKGLRLRKEDLTPAELVERLRLQMRYKTSQRLRAASKAYIAFLNSGGLIKMQDLSFDIIQGVLSRNVPILTGLSSTFLYHAHREFGDNLDPDDIRGNPTGHFVVLDGYDQQGRSVDVADPYLPNPRGVHLYRVGYDRLAASILLGVLTYDANLLVIEPL